MSYHSEEEKDKIKDFCKFSIDYLEIENKPIIQIQYNKNGIITTAVYDYSKDKKVIKIYGKNRHVVDIMRSIAHELVHHKQYEEGRLKVKPSDIGGEIEDEANAKAGVLIKLYGKKDNTIYE